MICSAVALAAAVVLLLLTVKLMLLPLAPLRAAKKPTRMAPLLRVRALLRAKRVLLVARVAVDAVVGALRLHNDVICISDEL